MKGEQRILIGLAFMAFSISLQFQGLHPAITGALIGVSVIFIGRGIRTMKQGEESIKGDERTRKIGAFALSYAWFSTLLVMVVMFWIDYLGVVSLNVQGVLAFLILFTIIIFGVFRWRLIRKGDVG